MKRSSKKESSGGTLTTLQTVVIMILLFGIIVVGVNAVVTYGSDREPNNNLFNNSQTGPIF